MKRMFCILLLALLVVVFSSCTDDSGFEGAVTSGTDDTSSASSLSICGVDISEFSIIYKSGCEKFSLLKKFCSGRCPSSTDITMQKLNREKHETVVSA